MAQITARYASTCPVCSRSIRAGSTVEWTRGEKATHVACAGGGAAPAPKVARARKATPAAQPAVAAAPPPVHPAAPPPRAYTVLPMCGDRALLVPADAPADAQEFARLLAAEASVYCGWPKVVEPSPSLIAATRVLWGRIAPGWIEDERGAPEVDAVIGRILAHSGVSHHVDGTTGAGVGGLVLDAERTRAWQVLQQRPDLAATEVRAFIDFRGAGMHRLDVLILTEYAVMATRKRRVVAYDGPDDIETRVVTREERGESVAAYVLRQP